MEGKSWEEFEGIQLTGRNRRLLNEWIDLDRILQQRSDIEYSILRRNTQGLPLEYLIIYRLRSICGVEHIESLDEPGIENRPIFSSCFQMKVEIPVNYPNIDAPIEFKFLCKDRSGQLIPHPWHPNIRYFGEYAGHVCLNAMNTFASLAWSVDRIGLYLRYDLYHAWQEPPYPEDPKVAQWVIKQGEPNEWIYFDQDI